MLGSLLRIVLLGLLPVVVAAGPPVKVRDIRIWAGEGATRVVLELTARAEHSLFSLEKPDRIVVDIDSASLQARELPAGQGVVKRIRSGKRDDGLRVVLDLTERVQAKSSTLEPIADYGYRLVIDLGGGSAERIPIQAKHVPKDIGRDLIIAIDAGHGGEDPGAIGRFGTREKDVSLAIARALARSIAREEGMRAVLIRDGDHFVSLRDRRTKARAHKADLFVSIHADSIRDRNVSGSSVYILSTGRASDEAARWLAERENAADLIGGVSLDDKDNMLASVLLDLSQTATLMASMTAAEQVLAELRRVGEVRKPRIQQASLAVLTAPDVPSMLVETAYISNTADERRLRDASYQERLANAVHAGIRSYFRENPPPGTHFAQLSERKRLAENIRGE